MSQAAIHTYDHQWMLDEALAQASKEWRSRPDSKVNKLFNRRLQEQRREVYELFRSSK